MKSLMTMVLALIAGGVMADVQRTFEWKAHSPNVRIADGMLVAEAAAGSPAAKAMNCARAKIDIPKFAGRTFRIDVRARGENLTNEGGGLKMMTIWKAEETAVVNYPEPKYIGGKRPGGTFGWTNLTCYITWQGTTVREAELCFGLQNASGKAVFDLSSLKIEPCEDLFPYVNHDLVCSYTDLVAQRPRLRGVMSPVPTRLTEDDMKTLASWGGKLLRYQMHVNSKRFAAAHPGVRVPTLGATEDEWISYHRLWLGEQVDHLVKNVIPWARKYGIMIVVDMHQTPGGHFKAFGAQGVFDNTAFADEFYEAWRGIARKVCGNEDVVYGYDLINEPHQKFYRAKVVDYWTLQEKAAREIRKVDPVTPIVFAANEASEPDAFRYFSPIDLTNVIYQIHFYRDNEYTHGRWASAEKARTYPDGKRGFDKAYLKRLLTYARQFQLRHRARLYCGEFSACGWAPGADRWMTDIIDLLEGYGWDWTFHAFREADMWSVEHVYPGVSRGLRPERSDDNPRKRALLAGFARAKEPVAEGDFVLGRRSGTFRQDGGK